jgi:hypothetical protein
MLAVSTAIAACGGHGAGDDEGEPLPPRQLVTAEGWTKTPEADDVFAAMKPGRTECEPGESYAAVDFGGYPAFEVHTDFCNYVTVSQPFMDDVHAGEHVNVRMWHFELLSPEPAEGYCAVAVDGVVRWEYTVQLPADGALASYGWITDVDIPAGTVAQFHVHNHGINSWNLIEIVAGPPPDDEG